jgi:AI-2 transport protein TqsA
MPDVVERKAPILPPVAHGLIVGATAWYLLRELTPILRPLLLAVCLYYVIVPCYHAIRSRLPRALAALVVGAILLLGNYLVALIVQDNVLALQQELPRLTTRAKSLVDMTRTFVNDHLPWLALSAEEAARLDELRVAYLRDSLTPALNFSANLLVETGLAAIYVMFLLFDVRRWPGRLQRGFHQDRSENIVAVFAKINASIVSYFRVQVIVNLILGVGVTLIMWATGTSFPVLWGLLNFFGNFIPYLGGIVGYTVPVVFGFLDHETGWEPVVAAVLMLVLQLFLAYVVVPLMAGHAVGLSPLVILISLAFWGLCWGVIGMVLAVPLTVIVKLILGTIPSTQPLSVLLADE